MKDGGIKMGKYIDNIEQEIRETILVKEKTLKLSNTIAQAAKVIIESYKKGGKLVAFGNGGSAADAQHIVAELVNKLYFNRPMLNAIALTVNTSVLTSIGNDSSFDEIFSRQLESLVDEKDIVIGISTSGNSKNVIKGLETAKKNGSLTIGMTGETGGNMKDVSDILINVPSNKTTRIQESHITIAHIICNLIERELFE